MINFMLFDSNVLFKLEDYSAIRNSIEKKYLLNIDVKKINFVTDKKRMFRNKVPSTIKHYKLLKGTLSNNEIIYIGFTFLEK